MRWPARSPGHRTRRRSGTGTPARGWPGRGGTRCRRRPGRSSVSAVDSSPFTIGRSTRRRMPVATCGDRLTRLDAQRGDGLGGPDHPPARVRVVERRDRGHHVHQLAPPVVVRRHPQTPHQTQVVDTAQRVRRGDGTVSLLRGAPRSPVRTLAGQVARRGTVHLTARADDTAEHGRQNPLRPHRPRGRCPSSARRSTDEPRDRRHGSSISPKTVSVHVSSIMRKLGVKRRPPTPLGSPGRRCSRSKRSRG